MIFLAPDSLGPLLQKALARGSRSTVLNPLAWFLSICATASIISFHLQVPQWLGIMFGLFSGIGALFYLGFYAYFSFTNKEDCLRSEKYSIQKMAIQRGFVGDDLTGYHKLPNKPTPLALEEEHKDDK